MVQVPDVPVLVILVKGDGKAVSNIQNTPDKRKHLINNIKQQEENVTFLDSLFMLKNDKNVYNNIKGSLL